MGQKSHPVGLRLGYVKPWSSRWYADRDYAKILHEDIRVRKTVKGKLYHAGVSKVEIERSGDQVTVIIHTARPGISIGRNGAEVDKLKSDLEKMVGRQVYITIKEIKKRELDAQRVTENIAVQLEKRVAFRRAMKRSVASALRLGARGIKIRCSGRLAGAEIARTEWYLEGRVPLHTLRADIDYGFREAKTTYGRIGVKVWLYKGDILPYKITSDDKATREAAMAVGETSGGPRPRRVVSAGGGRRMADGSTTVNPEELPEGAETEATPIIKEADPELERLLAEEEEIERLTREHHETPHFRGDE